MKSSIPAARAAERLRQVKAEVEAIRKDLWQAIEPVSERKVAA
jgi:hypothetical protein